MEVIMEKEVVLTQNAPKAIGPYSQAIKIGGMVYTSGQIPLDSITGQIVEGGIENQTRSVLDNLKAVLEASGATLSSVVKTTVFLKDMNQFAIVNGIYGEYFTEPFPARSCVQVAKLPRDVDVEIEAVAAIL